LWNSAYPHRKVAIMNHDLQEEMFDFDEDLPPVDRKLVTRVTRSSFIMVLISSVLEVIDNLIEEASVTSKKSAFVEVYGQSVEVKHRDLTDIKMGLLGLIKDGVYSPRNNGKSFFAKNSHFIYNPYFIERSILPTMSNHKDWYDFLDRCHIPIIPSLKDKDLPHFEKLSAFHREGLAKALHTIIRYDFRIVGVRKESNKNIDTGNIESKLDHLIGEFSKYHPRERVQELIDRHYGKSDYQGARISIDLGEEIKIRSYDEIKTKADRLPVFNALFRMNASIHEAVKAYKIFIAKRRGFFTNDSKASETLVVKDQKNSSSSV
jgi:hypothetical protein